MSDWKEYTLGDIAIIVDCEHKTAPTIERSDYNSIRTTNISGGKIDIKNSNKVSFETFQEWTKRMVPRFKDIILAREAPVGEVGWIPEGVNVCLGQRTVLIRIIDKNFDPKYILYYLTTQEAKYELISQSVGSVVSHLNIKDIKDFKLCIRHSHPDQRAIASILSSLDDKIDLLHRQNQTLEKMAETLFRQWFVEGAKEDWEIGRVEDLFILQRGFDLPIQNRISGKYPIYASSGESGYHKEFKIKSPGVTTGRSGVLGNVFYVQDDFWPLNTSLFVKEFNNSSPLHAYFTLKSIDLNSFNAGSAVPTLNRNHVHDFPIEIPPMNLILEFDKLVNPLFIKIKSNQTQIRTLTALRGTLLQKLMSGEVRVEM